jgi:hypothetical protein
MQELLKSTTNTTLMRVCLSILRMANYGNTGITQYVARMTFSIVI